MHKKEGYEFKHSCVWPIVNYIIPSHLRLCKPLRLHNYRCIVQFDVNWLFIGSSIINAFSIAESVEMLRAQTGFSLSNLCALCYRDISVCTASCEYMQAANYFDNWNFTLLFYIVHAKIIYVQWVAKLLGTVKKVRILEVILLNILFLHRWEDFS